MNPNWHDLIQQYISGTISDADAAALEQQLKADAALRDAYLDALNLDFALETAAQSAETALNLPQPASVLALSKKNSRPARWFTWRPLTAAAAGLAIGLFSASLVFGFAGNRHFSVLTLQKEGFEDAGMLREDGVPSRVDVWAGDLVAPREATSEVKPAEGKRMAPLPLVTTEKRRLSHAFRFIDVSRLPAGNPAQTRQIEVTAKFHCEKPGIKDRLQVRLAAFDESVDEAREIWLRDEAGELALMHVTKTVKTDPAVFGWNTVHAVIDLPDDANVLLISLAAGVAHGDKSKVDHYLDDVQVRLITSDMPLP